MAATIATLAIGFAPMPFWDEDEPRFAAIAAASLRAAAVGQFEQMNRPETARQGDRKSVV